jgi:hypothetical protein
MSQETLDLLLSGVKDQGQRKQITSAYYAFANGDPETFAVQFAVLLRAHAISLKLLPARLEKALATETRRMSELVLAHQSSVQRMVSLLDQQIEKRGGEEGQIDLKRLQVAIEDQLASHAEALTSEREKIVSTLTANGGLLRKLSAQRILVTIILSYIGGLFTVPILREILSFIGPMIH